MRFAKDGYMKFYHATRVSKITFKVRVIDHYLACYTYERIKKVKTLGTQ